MATRPTTLKDKYRVKYGPPTKSPNDVVNYMKSRHDLENFDTDGKDEKQEINNKLLQIISEGIDNIVLTLKVELGDDFETSNAKAFEIKKFLDNLKDSIDNKTANIGKNLVDGSVVNDVIQIDRDVNRSHTVSPNKRLFYRQDINPNINSDNIQIKDPHIFKNLDDNYDSILVDPNAQAAVDAGKTESSNKAKIEERLKNCQNLEFLYLKKHDEIMKIFEFTINLFDKYKYAIKVILFLLKNLVYKDPGTDKTPKIDLPLPIIKNIKKLVQDQNTVQGIITDMKTTLDSTKTFGDKEDHMSEKILNSRIQPIPFQPASSP
jgi:hypothetical protein